MREHYERREAYIWFSARAMENFVAGYGFRVIHGVPEGAKCVRVHHDWQADAFQIVFWHESFAIVPDGEMAPEMGGFGRGRLHFETLADPTIAES